MAGTQARRAGAAVALAGLAGIGLGTAAFLTIRRGARDLVTPPPRPWRDGRLLAVGDGEVTLSRSPGTLLPGRYGMWTDDDRGYAKVGEVLRSDEATVTRELIAVEDQPFHPGLVVRMGAAFYRSPAELGVPVEDVLIRTPVGPAPAWSIPAEDGAAQDWAILVHGRDAVKWETIRAVPTLRDAGWNCLIVSYRNDPGAPASPDGRYHLGQTEWEDVEAAIRHALDAGAERILLGGWSMGGAAVLQLLRRSALADRVTGAFLDSPALDWRGLIRMALDERHAGNPVFERLFHWFLEDRLGSRMIGLDAPLDLDGLDAVGWSGELRHPLLIQFSAADDVAPIAPARALAAARPELVRLAEVEAAGHVRIWNRYQHSYEATLRAWLPPRRQ